MKTFVVTKKKLCFQIWVFLTVIKEFGGTINQYESKLNFLCGFQVWKALAELQSEEMNLEINLVLWTFGDTFKTLLALLFMSPFFRRN